MTESVTVPAPLGFGLSLAIGEATWGDTSLFRFAAKVYGAFAGLVAAWVANVIQHRRLAKQAVRDVCRPQS